VIKVEVGMSQQHLLLHLLLLNLLLLNLLQRLLLNLQKLQIV